MSADVVVSRRAFVPMATLGVLGLSGRARLGQGAEERRAYIGTYTTNGSSEGIYILRMQTASGALRLDGLAARSTNPSFLALHPNGRVLYAVNEISEFAGQTSGAASAFAIDRGSAGLTPLNQVTSSGESPCYVSVDRTGRFALVANYNGGSVARIPLSGDGRLDGPGAVVRHEGHGPNPERQTKPHVHCAVPDPGNRYALVVDLGIDAVRVYRLDHRAGTMAVVAPGAVMRPGAGPRHLAFHPNGRFVYVVNELDSTLAAFRYDAERGMLEEIHTIANSPGGTAKNFPADVHVAPSGRVLYSSNRGDDSIAVFAIDVSNGRLTPVQQVSSGGSWPRNFSLDPTGRFLLVANQRSNSIVGFRVDESTGRLTPNGQTVEVASPVCVRFT
jgi:6-phosphogluconolactonase